MSVTEMQIAGHTVRFDRAATAGTYARIAAGFADGCDCAECRNFASQRDTMYPLPFRELIEQLGIDLHKEADAIAFGRMDNGLYRYSGTFFFAGEFDQALGEREIVETAEPYFAAGFTIFGPCPNEFRNLPHAAAVEFAGHFPWVLAEPEER